MSDLLEAILERDKESRSVACPLWYVSDEQRSRSPNAPLILSQVLRMQAEEKSYGCAETYPGSD